MTAPECLVILDVDHTLLHAWVAEPVYDWLAPDDPHRTPEARQKYKKTLMDNVNRAWEWNDLIVCPRPYLRELETFVLSQPQLKIAFYSTGAPIYLETLLPRVVPKLYKNALFVWGKDKCPRVNEVKMPYKDIALVSKHTGIDIEQIVMVDDLPTIVPWFNRLDISSFNLTHGIEPAQQDYQLLRLTKRLQLLLELNQGIHSQRMLELHNDKNWENLKNLWLTINKRKKVTESNYPVPRPLPFDHVPDTRDAVKDLLQMVKSVSIEEMRQSVRDRMTRPMTDAEYDAGGIREIDIEDD